MLRIKSIQNNENSYTSVVLNLPHVKESKSLLDSGFRTVDSGFQRLDSGFHVCGSRFHTLQIPGLLDSGFHKRLDSGFQKLDSGFQSPGFRILKAKICWILDSPSWGNIYRYSISFPHPKQFSLSNIMIVLHANFWIRMFELVPTKRSDVFILHDVR